MDFDEFQPNSPNEDVEPVFHDKDIDNENSELPQDNISEDEGFFPLSMLCVQLDCDSKTLEEEDSLLDTNLEQEDENEENLYLPIPGLDHFINSKERPKRKRRTIYPNVPNIDDFLVVLSQGDIDESVEDEIEIYKCVMCSYTSDRKHNIKVHLQKHIREHEASKLLPDKEIKVANFQCNECSFTCQRKQNLRQHMVVHDKIPNFRCDQCEFSCNRKQSLVEHQMSHGGILPFKCEYCDYKCKRKYHLKQHMKRHLGTNNEFHCDICNTSLSTKTSLERHLFIHSVKKQFNCPYCEVKCISKGKLKLHLRKHSAD